MAMQLISMDQKHSQKKQTGTAHHDQSEKHDDTSMQEETWDIMSVITDETLFSSPFSSTSSRRGSTTSECSGTFSPSTGKAYFTVNGALSLSNGQPYLNEPRPISSASDLTICFHSSAAPSRYGIFPKLKRYHPPLGLLNEGLSASDTNSLTKQRAWIGLSELSDERWTRIEQRILESGVHIPTEEIRLSKKFLMSCHKMEKLEIFAHNQICGAGERDITTTAGLPYQIGDNGDLLVEVRTSVGSDDCYQSQKKQAKLKSVVYNIRHMIHNSSNKTEHCHGARSKCRLTTRKQQHVKRPLNSYMLYRASMLRVTPILEMIESIGQIVEQIMNDYPNKIVNRYAVTYEAQQLFVLNRLYEIINDPDEQSAIRFIDLMNQKIYDAPKIGKLSIGQIISALWHTESEEVKANFARFSKIEAQLHSNINPHYKYSPVKNHKRSNYS